MTELQAVKKDKGGKVTDYGTAGAIAEEVLSGIHTVTSYGGQASIVKKYLVLYFMYVCCVTICFSGMVKR